MRRAYNAFFVALLETRIVIDKRRTCFVCSNDFETLRRATHAARRALLPLFESLHIYP